MMAAVAVGVYSSMDDCIADWVTPLLGDPETPDASEAHRFDRLFLPTPMYARQWRPPGTSSPKPQRHRRWASNQVLMQQASKEYDMTEPELLDLFVIGGGINGAGIARDAAGRGLKVVLCERTIWHRERRHVRASWCMAVCVTSNITNSAWCVRR